MGAMAPRDPPTSGEAPPLPLHWRVHPAAQRPAAAAAALLVILSLGVATFVTTGSSLWAVFAAAVLVLSLARFFFATDYELTASGVVARQPFGTRRLAWSELRRVEIGAHAAWLSATPTRTWREARRGVHLLFGRDRERILAALRRTIPPDLWPAGA